MNTSISNDRYEVKIADKGAEIQSFRDLKADIEYIWNGNPSIWVERSPLLFPIVGMQKDGYYEYNDKRYTISMHGFAKDYLFTQVASGDNYASYSLTSSDDTIKLYPFEFELIVTYTLKDNLLTTQFLVNNLSDVIMPFSLGAHPAFNIPIVKGDIYADYYLVLEEVETAPRYPLREKLLSDPIPYLNSLDTLALSTNMFCDGALIFKDLKSKSIDIKNNNNCHGVRVEFKDFQYLGLWAFVDAPYICIEPWNGIASSHASNHNILQKEGIHLLPPKDNASFTYSIMVY